MGSERSPKEKKRSRARSEDSSSSSDYEGKVKRHRGTEKDDERTSRRSGKKKENKSHKHHRSSSSKKSKDEKQKKKHAQGDNKKRGSQSYQWRTTSLRTTEFATWLKEESANSLMISRSNLQENCSHVLSRHGTGVNSNSSQLEDQA